MQRAAALRANSRRNSHQNNKIANTPMVLKDARSSSPVTPSPFFLAACMERTQAVLESIPRSANTANH